jgi:uncharacterized membrane protein
MKNKVSITQLLSTDHTKQIKSKNTSKNLTFDFIRGLAVVFMVLIHVLGTYANESVEYSFFYDFIDFLGSPPAAPVFMLSMGVFFVLSSKSDNLGRNLKRGFKLLFLGFLLSFIRSDLLMFTLDSKSFDIKHLVAFWEVDILQFAGCAYILMSLIKHYLKKPIWWLIIAVSVLLISPMVWGITSPNPILNYIFNFLWSSNDFVFFPIFAWLYYPLIGMILGVRIKMTSDINSLLNSLIKPGLILLAIGSVITILDVDFHIGDYYRSGPGSMIWILGFVFTWIALCNRLIYKVKENKFFDIIYYWGRQTTTIYFVHWLIVSWGTVLLGNESYDYLGSIILMGGFIIATHYLSKLFKITI